MKSNKQLVIGIRAVSEAIFADKEIDCIYIQKGLSGGLVLELKKLLHERNIRPVYVPAEKLNRLSRKNHQGVIAVISPVTYYNIEDIILNLYDNGKSPLILILDGITDVRNFGALVRSAECLGAHAIIIPERGSAPINEDAIKTSSGALLRLPVCRERNIEQAIDFLKNSGLQIIACSEKADKLITDMDFTLPTAFILGSEDRGIRHEYVKKADNIAKIPIRGEIASLNVSISGAIFMYEVMRQRAVL